MHVFVEKGTRGNLLKNSLQAGFPISYAVKVKIAVGKSFGMNNFFKYF
jgi:hypothetical protein